MAHTVRHHITALFVTLASVAAIPACSGKPAEPTPERVAQDFLNALRNNDAKAMTNLIDVAPKIAIDLYQQITNDAMITDIEFKLGPIDNKGDEATAPITTRFTAPPFASFALPGVLRMTHLKDRWVVVWSPQVMSSALLPGYRFKRSDTEWPLRAPILGAGDTPLTVAAPTVTVGIQGSRITDAGALSAALAKTGANAATIAKATASATAHPTWFVPVIDLPEGDYLKIKPEIYPIPGTVFRPHKSRAALTRDLAQHIVGTTGPITAELLKEFGAPYDKTAIVGRSRLELKYERQLAGRPGSILNLIDANQKVVTKVAMVEPVAGIAVKTTIEPTMQTAIEQAASGVSGEIAFVALRASTGEIVATVSRSQTTEADLAFTGNYPPGSTFKIITTANLLEHGLNAASPVTCPPTVTVDGREFHNFEGESATSLPLSQAFAISCNTAFIGAAQSLPNESFATTASEFGIGLPLDIGINTFSGNVPIPTTGTDHAATAIGQGRVVVSPLAMAAVAATVANGSWHAPNLVLSDQQRKVPASHQVNSTVAAQLQVMMGLVVTNGTARGRGLPVGTFGKTGTAEFGSADPPLTHAWFVGYRGDIAFAVIVVGGGIGGRVAAPIAAKFLTTIAK